MSEATKADRPLPVLSSEGLGRIVGAHLAEMLDLKQLNDYLRDTRQDDCELLAVEVAVARALLSTVSGSALLNGDKRALRDAGTLYRMVTTANNLLIGRIGGPAA